MVHGEKGTARLTRDVSRLMPLTDNHPREQPEQGEHEIAESASEDGGGVEAGDRGRPGSVLVEEDADPLVSLAEEEVANDRTDYRESGGDAESREYGGEAAGSCSFRSRVNLDVW